MDWIDETLDGMYGDRQAISVPEGAKALDVSVATAYRENKRGRLEFFKLGARTLILRSAMRDYLQLCAKVA